MNLTIVGLETVGASVGLALQAVTNDIVVTGHDPEPTRVQRAKKLGAIDKSHWNLISACQDADLILFDLAPAALEKTLVALRDEIGEQTVLLDTAPLKRPVLDLAARALPHTNRFVGGHLVLALPSQEGAPAAALIQGAVFYLVAPAGVDRSALDLATNFALAIGAKPHYVDALEHDSLMAATAQLPGLMAGALIEIMSQGGGTRDRAQAAGAELAALRQVTQMMPEGTAEMLAANAPHVLRWLDVYLVALSAWRVTLATGEATACAERLSQMLTTGQEWFRSAQTSDDEPPSDIVGGWKQMLLGSLGGSRSRPK